MALYVNYEPKFLMQKLDLKLRVLKASSLGNSLYIIILIDWMFPKNGKMFVDGFREKKLDFGPFLVNMNSKITPNAVIEAN